MAVFGVKQASALSSCDSWSECWSISTTPILGCYGIQWWPHVTIMQRTTQFAVAARLLLQTPYRIEHQGPGYYLQRSWRQTCLTHKSKCLATAWLLYKPPTCNLPSPVVVFLSGWVNVLPVLAGVLVHAYPAISAYPGLCMPDNVTRDVTSHVFYTYWSMHVHEQVAFRSARIATSCNFILAQTASQSSHGKTPSCNQVGQPDLFQVLHSSLKELKAFCSWSLIPWTNLKLMLGSCCGEVCSALIPHVQHVDHVDAGFKSTMLNTNTRRSLSP